MCYQNRLDFMYNEVKKKNILHLDDRDIVIIIVQT
jgi:hypothetical protein